MDGSYSNIKDLTHAVSNIVTACYPPQLLTYLNQSGFSESEKISKDVN